MKSGKYLEVLSNFTDKTLEGELADEQLGRLLVATNFTEGDGTGAEAVRLLDTTGSGRSLSLARLGSELLTGGLACSRRPKPATTTSEVRRLTTSGLAGGLLGASHWL